MPLTVTLHLTFVSLLVPPLVKLSVNVGAGAGRDVFVDPVCSVVPPTLTELSEWPCRPGATLPPVGVVALDCGADLAAMNVGGQPLDVGQELAALDLHPVGPADADAGRVQRAGDRGGA